MKNNFLISRKVTPYALLILLIGIALGIAYLNDAILPFLEAKHNKNGLSELIERTNYQGDLALTFLLTALYLIGFTKHKNEDEFIDFLRYQSLLKAALFQTAGIVIGTWLFGGITFLNIMLLNLFSFLLLFLMFFKVHLYTTGKKMRK
jgi:hypothetical protein